MGEIFISHATADKEQAARIAKRIELAGHHVFLDFDEVNGIPPGAAWQRRLFRELHICDVVVYLNSTAAQASMWCHSELVVAIELGKRIYSLDLAPELRPHPLLLSLQGIGFDADIDVGIRRLIQSLELDGLAGNAGLRWERDRPPYPGLEAMDIADAGVFFGRENEVRELIARVDGPIGRRDGDLVVVVGPSGAGKSSLVRAGLAARLSVPRSGWAVVNPFEPGARPLERLARGLVALAPEQLDYDECRARLESEGLAALSEWLANDSRVPAKRLLIILDQAEQLATVTSAQECADFLNVLGGGLTPSSPVTVVFTARSDRFDEIQQLPVIGPMIRAPFVIAPMNRSRLAAVIEGPAMRADLTFEPGLISLLADEAARSGRRESADALPFLAFVLREMYDLIVGKDRTKFTEADYDRVGRMDGAIKRRTKAAEDALPPGSELILDRMLLRFVALDEERLPAARPVPSEQLTADEQAVARQLEDQRLLVGAEGTVRLAHEQLITAWPRLAMAVSDRRDDLVMQARLERQADYWKNDHGELLGRDATRDARSWLAKAAALGTHHKAVEDYVQESETALRHRRVAKCSVLALIVALAIAATIIAAVAGAEGSKALAQSRLAQSEEMAAEAINLLPANGPLAMLVSLQAYERARTIQAESALIEASQQPLDGQLDPGSAVHSVAFSPDRHTVAAGDARGRVTLWSLPAGHKTTTLNEGILVDSLAFSPNGHRLAAGDFSGNVGLWNVSTGRRIATFDEGILVYSVAFSPDGRFLAVGDFGGHVGLWNVATGRRTGYLNEGHPVYSVAFSPDGRTLAVGDAVGHVGLWNLSTDRRTATLNARGLVYSVAFSSDKRTLAAGDAGGRVVLWDVATRRRSAVLNEGSSVFGVAFSPNGRTLAAGDFGGRVGLWDVATRRGDAVLNEGSPVFGVAFSPNGHTLAAGDASGDVDLWDAAEAQRANVIAGSPVRSVAFSPDGHTLAAGEASGHVGLWNVATGRRTAYLNEGHPVDSVAFSPGGHTLAVGDASGHVGLWNPRTRHRRASLDEGHPVDSVAFSPGGRILAVGDIGGHIGLWNMATRRRTAKLNEGVPVLSLAFSRDGHTLAVGDNNGDVGLWTVATGAETATLHEGSAVYGVAFSPGGHILAVGDTGGHVGLWNMATRHRTATLNEGSLVYSIAFSPRGQILAAADSLGNVGIWNVASGRPVALLAEDYGAGEIAFSPDGRLLAIGSLNGKVMLLRQYPRELILSYLRNLICTKVRHDMTRAQWATYAPGQPYQRTCFKTTRSHVTA